MKLTFTEQQMEIAALARRFAEKELEPSLAARDQASQASRSLYNKAAALGLSSILWPQKYGGLSADHMSHILACEQMCQVDDGFAFGLIATTMLFAWPVFTYGTEAQKQKWFAPTCRQGKLGAFCLTEAMAGSNAASLQTTASFDRDSYVINGAKALISNAGLADYYLIIANTMRNGAPMGISAFLAEKGTPGLSFGPPDRKLGTRTLVTGPVVFSNLRLPLENLLGQEGQGLEIAMNIVGGGRLSVAALGLGLSRAALRHSLEYSKQRQQFGRPLCANQALAFMLADMATEVEALALMVYRAAWQKDLNLPGAALAATKAKRLAAETSMRVAGNALQIFGGYGYLENYPVARILRNCGMVALGGGTTQIQQLIIAHDLLSHGYNA